MHLRLSRALAAVLVAACVSGEAGARWWEFEPPPTPIATPTVSVPASECTIDLLESEPAVPFVLVGLIEVQGRGPVHDPQGVLAAAKRRACELGGDALVILFRREGRRAGLPRPPEPGLLPEPEIRAAVIRYR
ncbi:MAG: hypothetical protein ACREQ9_22515 [Candidatus Binatia bacterium]